jgi:hypothetical protein
MSGRLSAALAWGMWVITLAVLVPTVPAVNVGDGPLAFSLLGALVLLAYATVGALIFLRQKTPPFRAGDEGRSSSPCATLPTYRKAPMNVSAGHSVLPSGEHAWSAVFSPGIPCL